MKTDNLIKKIIKLIKDGDSFTWEQCSYNHPYGRFGNEPSAAWNTWVSRIEHILVESVKPKSEPFIYFQTAQNTAIKGNSRDKFDLAKNSYIGALNSIKILIEDGDIFNELLIESQKENHEITEPAETISNTKNDKKIFIVHGHDNNLKIELEVFLSHIGLKPIVLHREADKGKTIIEKFESNSDVAYVFILLTPDEIAYSVDQEHLGDTERKVEYRARPNVIFEFGYFIAKLGRNKVCALYKSNVEIPSDLSGFIYKQVNSSIEEIGFSLIKELKAANIKIKI